jgi:hypothetical protein
MADYYTDTNGDVHSLEEVKELFDSETLDSQYSTVIIGGVTYLASEIVKKCDHLKYRYDFAEWLTGELDSRRLKEGIWEPVAITRKK